MSSSDRFLLEDVAVTVSDGGATPSDLTVCFTNVSHQTSRNFADLTASCDDDEVVIASKRRPHTFTLEFPWEGSDNSAHSRLRALDASADLGDFTFELPNGDEITFQAYVTLTLFTGGRYNEGTMARAELRVSNGYEYVDG